MTRNRARRLRTWTLHPAPIGLVNKEVAGCAGARGFPCEPPRVGRGMDAVGVGSELDAVLRNHPFVVAPRHKDLDARRADHIHKAPKPAATLVGSPASALISDGSGRRQTRVTVRPIVLPGAGFGASAFWPTTGSTTSKRAVVCAWAERSRPGWTRKPSPWLGRCCARASRLSSGRAAALSGGSRRLTTSAPAADARSRFSWAGAARNGVAGWKRMAAGRRRRDGTPA